MRLTHRLTPLLYQSLWGHQSELQGSSTIYTTQFHKPSEHGESNDKSIPHHTLLIPWNSSDWDYSNSSGYILQLCKVSSVSVYLLKISCTYKTHGQTAWFLYTHQNFVCRGFNTSLCATYLNLSSTMQKKSTMTHIAIYRLVTYMLFL